MAVKPSLDDLAKKRDLRYTGVSRLGNYVQDKLYKVPAVIAGAPVRGAKELLAGTLFGPKSTFGSKGDAAIDGRRLKPVTGKGRFSEISKEEYNAIKKGLQKGKAFEMKTGPLGKTYMKQNYRPGGLVGLAMKHPILASGAGLLAYYLATNPGARQAAGSIASGMSPTLVADPTASVQKNWAQPSFENPLASDVWGK
tara:strand:- start:370 stop:960 length:591 start_codon:yes stop_codon:yes gene_type:complete